MPTRAVLCYRRREPRPLVRFIQSEPFMVAEVETLEDVTPPTSAEFEALVRNVIGQFQQIVAESPTLSDELRTIAATSKNPRAWWTLWRLPCPF